MTTVSHKDANSSKDTGARFQRALRGAAEAERRLALGFGAFADEIRALEEGTKRLERQMLSVSAYLNGIQDRLGEERAFLGRCQEALEKEDTGAMEVAYGHLLMERDQREPGRLLLFPS